MNILVTGCAGFIGFHLAKRLINESFNVFGYDNVNDYYDTNLKRNRLKILESAGSYNKLFTFREENLINKKKLNEFIKNNNIKKVVHLAAQAGVRYSLINPDAYIESNLVGFTNILESCRHNDVENLIYASSSSVYGGNLKTPFKESDIVDHPISLYAATKKANELMAHTYSHLYNLPTTGLRFFTAYGPWGRPDMALFLFTKSILEGKPIKVFNNGDMIRDFTYIDDIIESIFRLLNKPANSYEKFDKYNPTPGVSWAPSRIFNIGNSEPIKLLDYIDVLEKKLNLIAKKEFLPMQPGDVRSTAAETSLLKDWLDFQPKTSIQVGISNFVDWYRDFYKV